MTKPKFTFGDRVKSRDDVFTVNRIDRDKTGIYYYSGEEINFTCAESGLTEIKEPLRAEFVCEWAENVYSPLHPTGDDVRIKLEPFAGKRTKVTIEEIPDESE